MELKFQSVSQELDIAESVSKQKAMEKIGELVKKVEKEYKSAPPNIEQESLKQYHILHKLCAQDRTELNHKVSTGLKG